MILLLSLRIFIPSDINFAYNDSIFSSFSAIGGLFDNVPDASSSENSAAWTDQGHGLAKHLQDRGGCDQRYQDVFSLALDSNYVGS